MVAKFKEDLREHTSAEAFRTANMARIENHLETKVDQNNLVAMTAVYIDAMTVQYQYIVDLLGSASARAVQQVNKHLMYLKETSTTAQIHRYGVVEVSDLPEKLRGKWLTLLKDQLGDAVLWASKDLSSERKDRLEREAQVARDNTLQAQNKQFMQLLAAQSTGNVSNSGNGKRKTSQPQSVEDQPKKAKNVNGYCKKEGLCIKYVRANLAPPLPTDPCAGQDNCKFNHAMPTEEILTAFGLKSAV